MIGDGIGSLLGLAFNMIKPALPKIPSTIGLSGLSAGVSHGINKALNKNNKCWSHIAPFSRLYLVKLKVVVQLKSQQ